MPDAVTLARKILSAVARVGQRFGVAHVTNVLRGNETELVTQRGHSQLSVFGLLAGMTVDEIRGYIEQLVAFGLVRQTDDAYPVLQLMPAGVALMKDAAAMPDLALLGSGRGRGARRHPLSLSCAPCGSENGVRPVVSGFGCRDR